MLYLLTDQRGSGCEECREREVVTQSTLFYGTVPFLVGPALGPAAILFSSLFLSQQALLASFPACMIVGCPRHVMALLEARKKMSRPARLLLRNSMASLFLGHLVPRH